MIYFVLAGLSIAFSFLAPETLASVIFGWAFCLFFALGLKKAKRPVFGAFLCGMSSHLVAFYWLPYTVEYFGGFGKVLAYFVFLLFCLSASLQFVFCALLFKRLLKLKYFNFALALATSWMLLEYLMPKLFPWAASHSQLAFLPFASLAEFISVCGLSGLMFYLVGILVEVRSVLQGVMAPTSRRGGPVPPAIIGVLCFIALLVFGHFRNEELIDEIARAPKVKIALIQGNIEAVQKNDPASFVSNLRKYRGLTDQAIKDGAELVLWPEAVFIAWTPEAKFKIEGTKFDPYPGLKTPLIYGGLSYKVLKPMQKGKEEFLSFNTAFARSAGGDILGFYHKKILMPFGEYMPFAKWFPDLKKLSPQTGDFTAGEIDEPIEILVAGNKVKAGMLICYEDLIPSLSKEVVKSGANLLVNLTNDAWYGNSAALRQHHLIAAWRAVENRKTLLRATNTGFTGVVSALGQTVERLETGKEGVLLVDVPLL